MNSSDSIIDAFSLSLRPFYSNRNVSTIAASFWFCKERSMLLILSKKFFFIWVIWAVEKEVNSYFNMPTVVVKRVDGILEIVSKFVFMQMI